MINGRCECGRVQYQVDGEINDFSHCHCSQCRRLHGAAFASFGGVLRRDLHYVSGEQDLAEHLHLTAMGMPGEGEVDACPGRLAKHIRVVGKQ